MRHQDQVTRGAWAGLLLVTVASAVAIVSGRFATAVLVCDVLLGAGTLVLTRAGLGALREQARDQEHESLHDPVTELPNRTLFHQQVQQRIAALAAGTATGAVMLLDLDRFKEVNDTLGHHQGDLLLHEIGRRIQSSLRPGDLIARLGGDEFAVFASPLSSSGEALALAERLARGIHDQVKLAGVTLEVEASIGLSLCPDHGRDVEELISRADVAMYHAKRQHSIAELYCTENDPSSRVRLGMLAELSDGIGAGELVVHYQPKVTAHGGRVAGFEALVRWQHPGRGLLFPDEFVPLAESTGLMRPLTSHVLDRALAQCREWRDAGHHDLTVAVNLSTRNLLDHDLPHEVSGRLAFHGLPASALELEITETTLMVDPIRAQTVITALASLGVGLAIDDFGTGYTSLSWLTALPVTTLKIDKSFVMQMTSNPTNEAIVRACVALGHNLGLRVVAEGVEDAGVFRTLAELGCDELQGYYISRPQPADDTEGWLARPRLAVVA